MHRWQSSEAERRTNGQAAQEQAPETPAVGAAPTSGPLVFTHDYFFAQGGPVEVAALPYSREDPAPFHVARWSVAAGTANDLDSHAAREVWLVGAGEGAVSWADKSARIQAGDSIAFDTAVPHRVVNDGSEALRVFSVYWRQTDRPDQARAG